MFESLLHSGFIWICGTIATTSWVGGVYSIYRGIGHLPHGATDVPFLSNDPRLITAEGRKWRRRVYVCAGWFVVALGMVLVVKSRIG